MLNTRPNYLLRLRLNIHQGRIYERNISIFSIRPDYMPNSSVCLHLKTQSRFYPEFAPKNYPNFEKLLAELICSKSSPTAKYNMPTMIYYVHNYRLRHFTLIIIIITQRFVYNKQGWKYTKIMFSTWFYFKYFKGWPDFIFLAMQL